MQNDFVPYTLKRSARTKRLRLAVYQDGAVIVTAPTFMNEGAIKKIIIQKSQWVVGKLEYFKNFPGIPPTKRTREGYLKHKEQAREIAYARIEYFNKVYELKFNRISIRSQKTRWGSCSKKGNLNFNYKIALLPERLSDYIIVHELCHLGEFNHSKNFWNLVAQTIPNHQELRNELKKFGKSY